jgi:YD repeat-containing protein
MKMDPLGNSAGAQYDLNGNLIQATDRKNQVTTSAYGPLGGASARR